jgi:hypothetical protein
VLERAFVVRVLGNPERAALERDHTPAAGGTP